MRNTVWMGWHCLTAWTHKFSAMCCVTLEWVQRSTWCVCVCVGQLLLSTSLQSKAQPVYWDPFTSFHEGAPGTQHTAWSLWNFPAESNLTSVNTWVLTLLQWRRRKRRNCHLLPSEADISWPCSQHSPTLACFVVAYHTCRYTHLCCAAFTCLLHFPAVTILQVTYII